MKLWNPEQSAKVLSNENPDSSTPFSPTTTRNLEKINQAHLAGELQFKKKKNLSGEIEQVIEPKSIITWGIKNNFTISTGDLDLIKTHSIKESSNPMAIMGTKGAKKSNAPHKKAKKISLEKAKELWRINPSLTMFEKFSVIAPKLTTSDALT